MKNNPKELVPVVCKGIPWIASCGEVFGYLPREKFDRMRLGDHAICDPCYRTLTRRLP